MISFVKTTIIKHRETILYLFFGFLTVVVNFLCYRGALYLIGGESQDIRKALIANTIAFFVSVIFAYFTNSLFVFRHGVSRKTFFLFFGARIGMILIDNGGMWLLLYLNMTDTVAKIITNAVIIILNYIISKFIIFKIRERKTNE